MGVNLVNATIRLHCAPTSQSRENGDEEQPWKVERGGEVVYIRMASIGLPGLVDGGPSMAGHEPFLRVLSKTFSLREGGREILGWG
jgi:hypothetical protein